ncbi:TcpQ domain-containing protein [Acidithiobacillus ferrianus]|uniref:TcpQ domain-containing protein n=1 Tax=Acidithiobacillus ferrianus TaxID=2678518 RepID=UPI0034E4AAB1
MKNSKATTAAVCSAILGGLCLSQFAMASGYSPAVPFQNKEAPSQIIGGVYIPAHEEPVMIQPGSVPFGTHKTSVVTNDVPDQSALNKLASQAENPQAEVALRSLEHKHGGTGKSVNSEESPVRRMGAATPRPSAAMGRNLAPITTSATATTNASPTRSTSIADKAIAITPPSSLLVKVNKQTAVAAQPVFIASGGKKLSKTLAAFLKKHHWNLLWDDQKTITPDFTTTYSGKSVSSVLNQIQNTYPQFNFNMWGVNRVVTVTPYSDQNALTTFSGAK